MIPSNPTSRYNQIENYVVMQGGINIAIANLSKLPPSLIHGIDTLLKGGVAYGSIEQAVRIQRAWPHGHVAAVLGQCLKLKLPSILHSHSSRMRDLAMAAIVARILRADSKLATARRLSPDTADSSLGRLLNLGAVSGDEMLSMLDWLLKRQPWIERKLAKRHLHSRMLILYDVTSSYVEDQCCPLAAFGYNRDGKKGKKQITFGVLCSAEGCPIAVEVFHGNTADGLAVHSFRTLLDDLATLTLNEVALVNYPDISFELLSQATELQSKAFELLDIDVEKFVSSTMQS